ncbi:MAG TPA: formyltransferase family protein [Candidatus Sulfotelmatobacter sp.]|nr:formyltransferase family protein [Candidatus Sulfotelmatobacter sp.]
MATTSAYLEEAARRLWSQDTFSFLPNRQLPPAPEEPTRTGDGPQVIFTGFPSEFSLAFLYKLLTLDVQLVGIITSPSAHPAILGDTALSRIAEHLDIPLLRLWHINDDHSYLDIKALEPEAVVMASFNQIVRSRVLSTAPQGWLNVHPSMLPAYRGPEPIYWAISEGATTTGITLHRAVPKFDAGPILAQEAVPIEADDTAGTLTRRLAAAGTAILPEAVAKLLRGDPGRVPDLGQATYRSSVGHRLLTRAATAVEAERMVRAGVPNMRAWLELDDHPVYVSQARVGADGHRGVEFADGFLQVLDVHETCGCHHDVADCPHREQ